MKDVTFVLNFLYRLIGYRLFLWLFCAGCAAVTEGFGIALLLPILEGGDPDGKMAEVITAAFSIVGLDYSFSTLVVVMAVFFLSKSVLFVLQDLYFKKIIYRCFVSLRCEFVGNFFRVDYQYFLGKDIGSITNAATIELQRLLASFEMCVAFIVSVSFSIVYFALPLMVNPYITLSVAVLVIPGIFIFRVINRITREYSLQRTANNSQLQALLIQAFQNFKYLKATNSSSGIFERIRRASGIQGRIYYKTSVLQTLSANSIEPVSVLVISGILLYQIQILGRSMLEIVFILFLLRRTISYVFMAQEHYRKLLANAGSIQIFRKFKQEWVEHREVFNKKAIEPDCNQPIRLQAVSFRYGGGPDVLKNINLVIPPKCTVAFVGDSGVGKSTLATLLTGMLRPSVGDIYLGDRSYGDVNLGLLRQQTGYVTQENVIFNDTIWNNITLWGTDTDLEKVRAAAAGAHIKEFIENLPEGYNTVLGDGGITISGGQRQRISIARELFKEVKLLIFDEATSSLDGRSEREIQSNIDEFRGAKTIVLIAHRLSTVRYSDLIFVLKNGEIVEQGSYAELYDLKGEFRSMVDQQEVERDEGR